jgi:hypothetical protein
VNEYEHEPIPGLPGKLPEGETILWQGAPAWWPLARRAYHVGEIAGYFVVLLAWSAMATYRDGGSAYDIGRAALLVIGLASVATGMLTVIAWGAARTSMYTITNRRVAMRIGIALPICFNLPFAQIEAAGLKLHADGSGDIPLALQGGQRIAYVVLWPHARPWRLSRSEPMLRAVPDARRVAQILGNALAASAGQPAQPASDAGRAVAVGAATHATPVAA